MIAVAAALIRPKILERMTACEKARGTAFDCSSGYLMSPLRFIFAFPALTATARVW
jgi:hypothetical protein